MSLLPMPYTRTFLLRDGANKCSFAFFCSVGQSLSVGTSRLNNQRKTMQNDKETKKIQRFVDGNQLPIHLDEFLQELGWVDTTDGITAKQYAKGYR